MEFHSVHRNSTFFQNEFIDAYYSGKLSEFNSYKPDIAELNRVISDRSNFEQSRRDLLVNELTKQYADTSIDISSSKVGDNIAKLQKSNAYTITTGQQIHVGLGPLYVLYKILDVLAICKEAKELHPEDTFVPVFWMASEDHDLEEIQTIHLFNKNFRWNTSQIGPVGRMQNDGISELFQTIESQFNLTDDQLEFIDRCTKYYATGTLASGFRKLLHSYFEDEGLVILDADSQNLKESVLPLLADELLEKNEEALKNTSFQLGEAGFKPLLVTRESNLFWISSEGRSKIYISDGKVVTEQGTVLCSTDEITNFVSKNAYNLSPNAALRPLYQEFILPNLVYVGGGSEVRYWHQLLGLFTNYTKKLPILHLRTSNIIIPELKVKANALKSVVDLFKTESELVSAYGQNLAKVQKMLETNMLQAQESLDNYEKLFAENISGKSINTRLQKILQRLEELDIYVKSELSNSGERSTSLDKVLKTKYIYANPNDIQERNEHIIGFADLLGKILRNGYSHFGLNNSQKINVILK